MAYRRDIMSTALPLMACPSASHTGVASGPSKGGRNKLMEITDPLAATAPAAEESFRTVRAARFAEVLRGVSFTPAR